MILLTLHYLTPHFRLPNFSCHLSGALSAHRELIRGSCPTTVGSTGAPIPPSSWPCPVLSAFWRDIFYLFIWLLFA